MKVTLGELQNNISTLPSVELSDYERIFRVYSDDSNGKDFYFYNILRKIEFPQHINSDYIDFYTVESAMPLTILAHKIYGNMKLWWILYLLNKDVFQTNIFLAPGGCRIKYITANAIPIIYKQISNQIIQNGRHF